MAPESTTTRERLVEAARDLFLQQGYTATGVAQILKKAEARSGSLYHFFPTKEDLLLAVLEWYRTHIHSDLLDPIWDRIDDPIERIFALLNGYRQMLLHTEFASGCPIGNLALELAESHPNARQLIATNFTNWLGAVRRCLDEAAGRLPENVDREQLAVLVLTTMEGGMMLARTFRSLDHFNAALTQLREYFELLLCQGTTWAVRGAVTNDE